MFFFLMLSDYALSWFMIIMYVYIKRHKSWYSLFLNERICVTADYRIMKAGVRYITSLILVIHDCMAVFVRLYYPATLHLMYRAFPASCMCVLVLCSSIKIYPVLWTRWSGSFSRTHTHTQIYIYLYYCTVYLFLNIPPWWFNILILSCFLMNWLKSKLQSFLSPSQIVYR